MSDAVGSIFSTISPEYRVVEVTESDWSVLSIVGHPLESAAVILLILLSVGTAVLSSPCAYERITRKVQLQIVKVANLICASCWGYITWQQYHRFPDYAWETAISAALTALHLYVLWLHRNCALPCGLFSQLLNRRSQQDCGHTHENPLHASCSQGWASASAPLLPVTCKDTCASPTTGFSQEPHLRIAAALAPINTTSSNNAFLDASARLEPSTTPDSSAMSEKMLKFYQSKLSFTPDDKTKHS